MIPMPICPKLNEDVWFLFTKVKTINVTANVISHQSTRHHLPRSGTPDADPDERLMEAHRRMGTRLCSFALIYCRFIRSHLPHSCTRGSSYPGSTKDLERKVTRTGTDVAAEYGIRHALAHWLGMMHQPRLTPAVAPAIIRPITRSVVATTTIYSFATASSPTEPRGTSRFFSSGISTLREAP